MKKKGTRIILFLSLLLAALCYTVPAQAAKVVNNGTDTVQYGKYIYFLDGKNTIYRIGTDNKGKKKLGSVDSSSRRLYILGNKIYFCKNGKVYASPLNKKSPKAVVSGQLLGAYGSRIIYLDSKGNVYSIKTDKTDKKWILALKKGGEIRSAGTSGKVLILNCQWSAGSTNVVYVDMEKGTYQPLAIESRSGSDGIRPAVEGFVVKGSTLYYAIGSFSGNGLFFNGSLRKVSLSGTDKPTTIASNIGSQNSYINVSTDCLLYENGGYLYFPKDQGAHKYKFSNGQVSSAAGNGAFTAAGKYVYYAATKNKTVTIYRFSLSASRANGKKVTSFKVKDNYDYTISKVTQVGNYLILRFDQRVFSVGENHQGTYKGTAVYKMKSTGKGLKKIG